MNAPLYNPGIYHDTLWQFGVTILDRTTEEPVNISAMTIIVDVYDRAGEAAVFQFSGAGDADTGEVDMTGAGAGVFIVRATASQHAYVTPGGPYYWEARNVADALDPQYVANGTLYVGKAGERQTKWEVLNTYEGTFGQASLPGVIITVAGDVLVRDTLADLRAVLSPLARTTYVLGHTTVGDGGAGMFRWDAASEEPDDDGLVVQPDDIDSGEAGRYIREFEGDLNIRMWGMVDDGGVSVQTVKQQRALDAASARKIPLCQEAGEYTIGQVFYGSDTDWYGRGTATIIYRDPAMSKTLQLVLPAEVDLDTPARVTTNVRIRSITWDASDFTWPRWLQTSSGTTIADPEADYAHPGGVLVSGLTLPTLTAVVSNGQVIRIDVDSPGAGFGTHPTFPYAAESVSLKIEGGGGYGASASAVLDGDEISQVVLLARGRDYATAPTVTVIGGYANPTILIDASVNRRNPNFTQTGICIAGQKVDGFTVEDCHFIDYGSMVIADQGCKDGLIQRNTFLRCGKNDGPFPCVWVQSFGNPAAPAAFYQDSENCRVLNNQARDLNRLFALFAPTKGGVISGNFIDGAKESGIFIPTNANRNGGCIIAEKNVIKNVVVSDIVAAAFEVNAPALNILIRGNYLENCEGGALTGSGCNNIDFSGNQVVNCGRGTGLLPYGPFSERVLFAVNTEARANDAAIFPVFALGYAAGLAATNIRIHGNLITEDRDDPPFFVIGHVRSGDDPPDPLCTNHYVHDNTLIIPATMAFVDDSFTGVFEPNGFLTWNNPGSGWTGFIGRDDKFKNFIIDRVDGSGGNSFLKHQLSPDSVLGMLAQLGLDEDLTLCLDAGDINSYASGQQWSDVSGANNHYNRGTTSGSDSTDPTFNGTPGGESFHEFWSVDGGDYFTPTASHTFASTWHQNNAEFTFAMVFKLGALDTSNTLFSTVTSTASGTGIFLHITSELNVPEFAVFNAGTTVKSFPISSVLTTDDFYFVAFSVDEAGDFGDAIAFLGGFLEEYDPAYDTPAAGSANGAPRILANVDGSSPISSGSRVAAVMAWDRALTQSELSRVRNALSLRFPSI